MVWIGNGEPDMPNDMLNPKLWIPCLCRRPENHPHWMALRIKLRLPWRSE